MKNDTDPDTCVACQRDEARAALDTARKVHEELRAEIRDHQRVARDLAAALRESEVTGPRLRARMFSAYAIRRANAALARYREAALARDLAAALADMVVDGDDRALEHARAALSRAREAGVPAFGAATEVRVAVVRRAAP